MDTKLIKRKNEDSNGLTLAISNNDNNNDNSSNINSNQLTSTTATHATKTTNTTITNNKNKSESVPYTTMASLSKLNVTKSSQKTSTTAHNSTNQQSPITASAGSAKIADIDLNHVSIRVSDINSYEQQICEPESDSELTSALSKSPLTQITNNSAPNTNLNNGNEQGKMENPLNAAHANENNENVLKQSNSRVSKTRGSKNIFKTIFCCFSNVNRKRPNQNKNNISNSASNINSNTNKQTITTMVSKNELHDSKSIRINNEYNNQSNSNFKQAENSAVNGHQNNPLTNIQMNYANEQRGSENQKPDEKSLVDDAEHELIDEHEHDADHQHLNYRNSQANDNNSVSDRNSYLNQNDNLYNNHDKNLLPPIRTSDMGKKCLIIDLDETLVHSSFKQVHNADFVVPVEIDGIIHQVYVLKRPHVDEFLKRMGELFECVLFTASLAKYADPVADLLDKWGVFRARLFREACVYYRGNYVKDLSRLGRDLNKVIILDNSPISYIFHPDNAVACTSWFEDPRDNELIHLIPHFENLAKVDSVYSILKNSNQPQQHHQHFSLLQTMNNLPSALFRHSHHNKQQQQNLIKQHQDDMHYDESTHNQQVPSPTYAATTAYNQQQSIIYQQQQQQQQQHILNNNNINNYSGEIDANNTSSVYNRNNPNMNKYVLNENKILLSIDMMTANKAQQHNPITQLSNPY